MCKLQKAVVELLWIGGQQKDILSSSSSDFAGEAFLDFSANELNYWESDILWHLTKYENVDNPLVVWDIVAALLAFKQSAPKYTDHILVKWLSVTFLGSYTGLYIGEVLTCIPENFSKITSRQLHLFNIICRRVILSDVKAEEMNCKVNLGGQAVTKAE
ncbi:GENERAL TRANSCRIPTION FACTOR 3C POLYPEPTIDE 4 [Salix viminalis]|uniref:GENERAL TRANSCRIPTION FACTOR 3C POLYPEPTIDE 4 n=1 Tax=Salix viminalis TaxID=40686 RepID=A0A9Q0SH00_SALVM|nr:GENERAL TRANSCRIPTION FACTOR 3C POLYPEPTIDE 4 [Salix viminalis]